jgi:gluconolactonase
MYQPAKLYDTRVFAKLPEKHHWKGKETDWLKARPWGRPGCFFEGPSFDRSGRLLCTDIPYGRIFEIDESGEFDVFVQYAGEPNGLRIHKDGRIFVADPLHGIVVIDPESRKVETFLNRVQHEGLRGPNDLIFTSKGDLYFTDMGQSDLVRPIGLVVHVPANGTPKVVAENIPGPNGLVMNADETMLYLAVTRLNQVWQLTIRPDGSVSKTGVYIQMSGGIGPDGMAVDSKGNLYVAHAGVGCVWVFDPAGEPLYRLNTPGRVATNLAFKPSDPKKLFITEATSGTISVAEMPDPGQPLFSHM